MEAGTDAGEAEGVHRDTDAEERNVVHEGEEEEEEEDAVDEEDEEDEGAMVRRRRNLPGSSYKQWNVWPWVEYKVMESSLAVQQWIEQLVVKDPFDVEAILHKPDDVDLSVWQYEHIRYFVIQLNVLLPELAPVCSADTCPEMDAQGQKYLCAAHNPPIECNAIDYMVHTLDNFTALLNSPKIFPSRVAVSSRAMAHFGKIVRRLYRIFSHMYFAHADLFHDYESRTQLCRRYTTFALRYDFLSEDALLVPDMVSSDVEPDAAV